jgi:hypothetical protein
MARLLVRMAAGILNQVDDATVFRDNPLKAATTLVAMCL